MLVIHCSRATMKMLNSEISSPTVTLLDTPHTRLDHGTTVSVFNRSIELNGMSTYKYRARCLLRNQKYRSQAREH